MITLFSSKKGEGFEKNTLWLLSFWKFSITIRHLSSMKGEKEKGPHGSLPSPPPPSSLVVVFSLVWSKLFLIKTYKWMDRCGCGCGGKEKRMMIYPFVFCFSASPPSLPPSFFSFLPILLVSHFSQCWWWNTVRRRVNWGLYDTLSCFSALSFHQFSVFQDAWVDKVIRCVCVFEFSLFFSPSPLFWGFALLVYGIGKDWGPIFRSLSFFSLRSVALSRFLSLSLSFSLFLSLYLSLYIYLSLSLTLSLSLSLSPVKWMFSHATHRAGGVDRWRWVVSIQSVRVLPRGDTHRKVKERTSLHVAAASTHPRRRKRRGNGPRQHCTHD